MSRVISGPARSIRPWRINWSVEIPSLSRTEALFVGSMPLSGVRFRWVTYSVSASLTSIGAAIWRDAAFCLGPRCAGSARMRQRAWPNSWMCQDVDQAASPDIGGPMDISRNGRGRAVSTSTDIGGRTSMSASLNAFLRLPSRSSGDQPRLGFAFGPAGSLAADYDTGRMQPLRGTAVGSVGGHRAQSLDEFRPFLWRDVRSLRAHTACGLRPDDFPNDGCASRGGFDKRCRARGPTWHRRARCKVLTGSARIWLVAAGPSDARVAASLVSHPTLCEIYGHRPESQVRAWVARSAKMPWAVRDPSVIRAGKGGWDQRVRVEPILTMLDQAVRRCDQLALYHVLKNAGKSCRQRDRTGFWITHLMQDA